MKVRKQGNLSHSSVCENQKTQRVGGESVQDGLPYQMKLVPSSFPVNVTQKSAQYQNHRIGLCSPGG